MTFIKHQIFLAIFCIGSLSLTACKASQNNTQPSAKLAAKDLFEAFSVQESTADQKYTGSILEVDGKVIRKGFDSGQRPFVNLEASPAAGDVQCFFLPSYASQAQEISTGTLLTVQGLCLGRRIHVTLDNCKITASK